VKYRESHLGTLNKKTQNFEAMLSKEGVQTSFGRGSALHLLRPGRDSQRLQAGGMKGMPLQRRRARRLAGAGHPSVTEHPVQP